VIERRKNQNMLCGNETMSSRLCEGLHVAIIMDGNGRWAARRGLPRVAGHRAGARAAQRIVERASDLDIACLTLYAFSSDNWQRPVHEVQRIFWLLRAYLRVEAERLRRRDGRIQIIGRRDRLPKPLLREIDRAEAITARGQGLLLRVAIDYSSRNAIARAASMAALLIPNQLIDAERMGHIITQVLTAERGNVDLLIRTGDEKRLSDFLLWECAYAELLFSNTMWPDFGPRDLDAALEEFHRRERRFGAVPLGPSPALPSKTAV
jgi:undecaprenyl diphosphate synthase